MAGSARSFPAKSRPRTNSLARSKYASSSTGRTGLRPVQRRPRSGPPFLLVPEETMASIPITEYLTSTYHPDVDYVDDHIEERNVGEKEHGKLQFRVAILLERQRTLIPFLATRLMISPTRYRVPDVCAYEREPDESIFTQPPALCIEVLSPEDRLSRIIEVAQDYLAK